MRSPGFAWPQPEAIEGTDLHTAGNIFPVGLKEITIDILSGIFRTEDDSSVRLTPPVITAIILYCPAGCKPGSAGRHECFALPPPPTQ